MTIQSAPEGSEHTEDFPEPASGSPAVGEDFQPDILEQAAGPAPVLITEQQVLFGTAAALPPRPAKRVRPILLLAAMTPKPYPQSWYQRWSRHTSSKSLR